MTSETLPMSVEPAVRRIILVNLGESPAEHLSIETVQGDHIGVMADLGIRLATALDLERRSGGDCTSLEAALYLRPEVVELLESFRAHV